MLLEEEKSTNVVMMDKAWEVWSKENAIIFHCTNVAPMEEDQEASLEENTEISDSSKKGALSTTIKGDEEMEEGMKNAPCMKIIKWHERKCELMNHV
jgi:hypothetical protein